MTPVDHAVIGTESAAVDLKMPAPGDQGYDEWRKTGKLPEGQDLEVEQETPPKKETPAASETPSATESDVTIPSEEVETAAASEPARPQQGKKKDAAARVKELLDERKEDQRLLRDALQRLARLELPEKRETQASQPATETEKKPKAEAAKPEPQIDDKGPDGKPKYATYAAYQKDWSAWVRDEAIREARAAATDTTAKSQKERELSLIHI